MRTAQIFRIAVLTLASASLGGCIFFSSPADRALRRTPAFKDGYADGCASAQQQGADFRGNLVRDDAQYNSDQTYRTGWGNGYQTCRPIEQRQNTTAGSNPLPQPDPTH
jgi:hypothetical protein